MSKLALTPNGAGTGTYTLASPNNNASHTLTLPAVTGTLLTSAGDGSALTSLTSNNLTGALPAIDGSALTGISAGGLKFISSVDISNDSTVEFTGFDSALYDSYEFVLGNVRPTNGQAIVVRVSSNGGTSYDSGASDYQLLSGYYSFGYLTSAVGSGTGRDGACGVMHMPTPHLARSTHMCGSGIGYRESGGNMVTSTYTTRRVAQTAVDAIQFLASSGSLLTGTITMYGKVNS